MKISDMVHVSNAIIKICDANAEISEQKYDIDISDQQIIEYFDVISHIDRYYYNNSNLPLINYFKSIALKTDFIQVLSNDSTVSMALRESFTALGVKTIRSIGKDIVVHVIKQWIDRIFSHMRYNLSVNYELMCNTLLQSYLINLNHIIRVKIKKYIQMDADFCEYLAKIA